jgi:hypothetical protein
VEIPKSGLGKWHKSSGKRYVRELEIWENTAFFL